jgi:DNA-binding MarR family transcriptional regulator
METQGLVEETPAPPDNDDGRRRYYRITEFGREAAERESVRLARLVAAARAKKLLSEETA